ncbi:uncharacterized protein K452DRAFT_359512 [Aplosporella prunicola CBS 121167]|uniref:F-box domain-containing protein n=1 Tax=Aplosporella prunicola CBS 121167 TaxID=1176127 RepID=A0A6A6BD55_9PEZI|nr:uncharacterized protein K452DRAFT_359512 [Aplosporella prunicola CBS 121167]KAF2141154.1 hypothetical protein K452DRAFT_359512 [Aplosporella prunicola CBS 121167]
MDSLPEEIFSTIISLVCDGLDPGEDTYGLPHLATVSRRWQCTIENRTFRELTLNSRQLPELSKRFSGPFLKHRAVLVRSIEYHIELPCCSDEKVHQRATEQDVQETNVAISKAVRDLFDFLLLLDQARPNGPSLALGIMSVKAPTDGSLQGQDEDRFIDCEHRPVPQMSYYTYWSLRWRYKILSLLEIDELPEISCVTLFEARPTGELGTHSIEIPVSGNSDLRISRVSRLGERSEEDFETRLRRRSS